MCKGHWVEEDHSGQRSKRYPRISLVERSQAAMEATAFKALADGIIRRIVGQPQRLRLISLWRNRFMWFWTLIQRMVSSLGFPHRGDLRVTSLYRYMHKVSSRHRQYSRKPLGPKKT